MESRYIAWKSKLVDMAEEAKFTPPIYIIVGWAILIFLFVPIPGYMAGQNFTDPAWQLLVGELILAFGAMAAAVLLFVRFAERRPISTTGLIKDNALKRWGKGFGLGAGVFLVIALVSTILGGYTISFSGSGIGLSALPMIVLMLVGWTIQAGTEELVARGWLMPHLSKRYNVWIGIVGNALLFLLMRGMNPAVGFLPFVNIGLFGVIMSIIALWQGEIWTVAGIHAAWNFVQSSILGMHVTGTSTAQHSLVQLVPQNVGIISGGAFGLEGSVITTVVLAGILMFVLRKWTTELYVTQRQKAWKKNKSDKKKTDKKK